MNTNYKALTKISDLECLQCIFFDFPTSLCILDLYQRLPSEERLWQIDNQTQWEQAIQSAQGTAPVSFGALDEMFQANYEVDMSSSISIVDIFHGQKPLHHSVKCIGNISRLITMVTFYVKERKLLGEANSWMSLKLYHPSTDQMMHRGPMTSPFDDDFQQFELGDQKRGLEPANHFQKFYHLLSILRYIPLQLLYRASGWRTTQSDPTEASQALENRLQCNVKTTRHLLLHAATLFRTIRNQTFLTASDPLSLLIATLYIWFYCKYMIELNSNKLSTDSDTIINPIRVDQDLNMSIQQTWIQSGGHVPVHITGVGCLDKPGSSSRVLKEAIRIMSRQNNWAEFSQVIARALGQVLSGQSPSFAAPV